MPTMKPTVPASTVITIKTYVSESQSLTKLKVVKNFNATQEQKSSKLNFVYGRQLSVCSINLICFNDIVFIV